MGILSTILGSAGKDILDTVSGVVDDLTLSKEEKEKFNLEMQRLVQEQFAAVQASVQARFNSVMAIIQAEMASGDNYTKRARPTVVYVGLLLFALQVTAQFFPGLPVVQIPVDFTIAWASVVGVWSVGRSFEKAGVSNKSTQAITGNNPYEL